MTERPILMNAEMVRAGLDGSKTQTRRVVKLPHQNPLGTWEPTSFGGPDGGTLADGSAIPAQHGMWHSRTGDLIGCPLGQPGDRLWVRETWQLHSRATDLATIVYGASRQQSWTEMHQQIPAELTLGTAVKPFQEGWRPSIHMPRWACRIVLEIVSVRVERLQDISEADAEAEGCIGGHGAIPGYNYSATPMEHFAHVWQSIYGQESWDSNPWVWIIEFKRVQS